MTLGAHNTLLEMWINAGLIGLLSFFAMQISAFSRPWQISSDKYMFGLAYMAFYTLAGFTERGLGTYGYKILFLFIAIGFACQKDKSPANGG